MNKRYSYYAWRDVGADRPEVVRFPTFAKRDDFCARHEGFHPCVYGWLMARYGLDDHFRLWYCDDMWMQVKLMGEDVRILDWRKVDDRRERGI